MNNDKQIKYIYLDVVRFTDRTVEAQSDIIQVLNSLVKESVINIKYTNDKKGKGSIRKKDVLFLPSGDGMCIALFENNDRYDVPLLIALEILRLLAIYNEKFQADISRSFRVRIGLNGNHDNLIKDINGKDNVAGAGINYAQRIMSLADGGQILVGQSIHEILTQHDKYLHLFKQLDGNVKYNKSLKVFQYIGTDIGVNIDQPSSVGFKSVSQREIISKIENDLIEYENRYCQDYKIRIKLSKLGLSNVKTICCRIDYDYYKTINNNKLSFLLHRIRSQEQKKQSCHTDDGYYKNELYYVLDEIDLVKGLDPSELNNLNKKYEIGHLYVNQLPINLTLIDSNCSDDVNYEATLPEETNLSSLINIKYSVSFPIETESFIFPTFELPTKNADCCFDYSEIRNEISVVGQAITKGPVDGIEKKDGELEHHVGGWSLPKSGFLFVWWPTK